MSRNVCLAAVAVILLASGCIVYPSDHDVDVLLFLTNPYGGNTLPLCTLLEDRGWNLTIGGLTDPIENCHSINLPMAADVLIPDVDLGKFDAVVFAPTPGASHENEHPAKDLEDPETLELIRGADHLGLTLYAGCASTAALADAGVLNGRHALVHPYLGIDCEQKGIECTLSSGTSAKRAPIIDRNLVTGSNQRLFRLEIAEAIARSIDLMTAVGEPRPPEWISVDVASTAVAIEGAITAALTLGTPHSDVARAVCQIADGYIVVGLTYSRESSGADALVVKLSNDLTVEWARVYGGPGQETADDVCALPDGGVAIVGSTTSTSDRLSDAFVLNVSNAGDLIWAANLGSGEDFVGLGICAATDGGTALCGFSRTDSPVGIQSDVFAARCSDTGETLWVQHYGGAFHERGSSIVAVADGGFAIAGCSSDARGHGNYDALLLRLDEQGDLLFEEFYGARKFDIAESVILTDTGGFAIAGSINVGSDIMDACFVLADSSGAQLSRTVYGGTRNLDYARAIVQRPDRSFVAVGRTNAVLPGFSDAWILKVSAGGQCTWEQPFGAEGADGFRDLCGVSRNQALAVGYTASFGSGSYDMLISLIDVERIP